MYHLWSGKGPFPQQDEMNYINNIEYIDIHTAIRDEYQFLLGAAIIKHKDVFYASWGNSFRMENDDNTILAQKCSFDGGKTWSDYRKISKTDKGYGRSHGVYFEYQDHLYAFCPKARYDKIDAYPDLKMEAYKLDETGEWECLGIVLNDDTKANKDELIDILSTYPGDIVVFFKIDGKNYKMTQTVRNCRGLINELLSIVDENDIKFFKTQINRRK
jgi:hypothetical protein